MNLLNLYKALASFHREVPTIAQGDKAFNYTYASLPAILEVVEPILARHGLSFYQSVNSENGTNFVLTVVFHADSGESISGQLAIPAGVQLKGQNDFQVLGSAITYLRRYALSAMLGIVTEKDTDAHGEQVRIRPRNVGGTVPLETAGNAHNALPSLGSDESPVSPANQATEVVEAEGKDARADTGGVPPGVPGEEKVDAQDVMLMLTKWKSNSLDRDKKTHNLRLAFAKEGWELPTHLRDVFKYQREVYIKTLERQPGD